MAGYDPSATRERLETRRELVAGNLTGYRKQMANSPWATSSLIPEAIAAARRELDRIDQELATLPGP
jgi:hypothetical protein